MKIGIAPLRPLYVLIVALALAAGARPPHLESSSSTTAPMVDEGICALGSEADDPWPQEPKLARVQTCE